MMQSEQKSILAKFIEAVWNQGDFSKLADYVADGYSIKHDPGDAWEGQSLDLETFRERVMYSRNAFPDLRFDIQEMLEEDNKVLAFWRMSGTHLGDLENLPATGKSFLITGMTIYEFEGDKLISHTQAYDRLGFVAQMGILG